MSSLRAVTDPYIEQVGRSSAMLRKRSFDLVVGFVFALIAIPAIVTFALAITLRTGTSPFFRQKRAGQHGQPFWIIKLRTLPRETPAYADKHDLDIQHMPLPWLCRFLRDTHLDELPQLFLVVAGRMSLVGPRPRMLNDAEPIHPAYDAVRTSVRPGCAGLWQISVAAGGTATSVPAFDLSYVWQWSLRLDLWILCRTVGWMLGIARPIALADIPRRLLGRGLISGISDDRPLSIDLDGESVAIQSQGRMLDPLESPAIS